MNTWVEGLIIAVGVCLIVLRRFQGTRVNPRRLLVLPVVLGVLGVKDLASVVHGHLGTADIGMLVLTGLVSLAVGLARGNTIRLVTVDGVLLQRYRFATLGWWLASAALRVLLRIVANGVHAAVAGNLAPLPLMLGITFFGEGLVVLARSGAWTGAGGGPGRDARSIGFPRTPGDDVVGVRLSQRPGRPSRLEQRIGLHQRQYGREPRW